MTASHRRALPGPGRTGAAVALILLAGAAGYPLVLLFLQSLFPEFLGGDWSNFLRPYRDLLATSDLLEMIRNSLAWAGATTLVSWVFGIPCGFLLARCQLPGKGLARWTLLAPVMTPPYVAALAYILIMQPGGFADQLVGLPHAVRAWFFSFHGVTLVMALSSFGYVALGIEAALRRLPPRLEDAARQLGAGNARIWVWVLLPLLLPAILNTGILVFLDALSNFGVPAVLGARANLPLLPAEIFHLLTSWPIDLPLATALSSLLCLFAVVSVAASRRLSARGAGDVQGAFRPVSTTLSRTQVALAWGWIGSLFLLSTILPYAAMISMSFMSRWGGGEWEWTTRHYTGLFAPDAGGRAALQTSLLLSLGAATICVIAGGFIAYVAARVTPGVRRWIDTLAVLPRVLPKIVMAVALILAWNAPWIRANIYGTVWMLLLAYVVIYITDALSYGGAAMSRANRRLETAAFQLGAGRGTVFARVILPHLAPALGAAWLTTFIVCMRELVASMLLLPPGVQTTATFIFNQFEQGDLAAAMAMATVTIGLTTAVLLALQSLKTKSRNKQEKP